MFARTTFGRAAIGACARGGSTHGKALPHAQDAVCPSRRWGSPRHSRSRPVARAAAAAATPQRQRHPPRPAARLRRPHRSAPASALERRRDRRQGRQGRHHPARHHVLAPLGHRRPDRAQGSGARTYNLDCDIQNAGGCADARCRPSPQSDDRTRLKVLMIVNLDPASGAQDRAGGQGQGRHHRRLRPAHPGWRRSLYVSFDNVKVGETAGQDPDQVPAGQGQERRSSTSRSTARRPTTTPPCSSRATTACCRRRRAGRRSPTSDGNWDAPHGGRQFSLDAAARTRTSRP